MSTSQAAEDPIPQQQSTYVLVPTSAPKTGAALEPTLESAPESSPPTPAKTALETGKVYLTKDRRGNPMMLRRKDKPPRIGTGFALLTDAMLGYYPSRRPSAEQKVVEVTESPDPDPPQPQPQIQYFALAPQGALAGQLQLCAPSPSIAKTPTPVPTRAATPQPSPAPPTPQPAEPPPPPPSLPAETGHGPGPIPTNDDAALVTFRLPSEGRPRERYRSGSTSRERRRNHESFVARHVCAGCGKIRSASYHYRHPLVPGQILEASFCRRCVKDVTSEEDDGQDQNHRPKHRRDGYKSRRASSHGRNSSSSMDELSIRKSRKIRDSRPRRRQSDSESESDNRKSRSHRKSNKKKKKYRRRNSSSDEALDRTTAADDGKAPDKERRRLRVRISEESIPTPSTPEVEYERRSRPVERSGSVHLGISSYARSRSPAYYSGGSVEHINRREDSRSRGFTPGQIEYVTRAPSRSGRRVASHASRPLRHEPLDDSRAVEARVDSYHRAYGRVARGLFEDFVRPSRRASQQPSRMESRPPMTASRPDLSDHRRHDDLRYHQSGYEPRRGSSDEEYTPANHFHPHLPTQVPERSFIVEAHQISAARERPLSPQRWRRRRSSLDGDVGNAGSRDTYTAPGPPSGRSRGFGGERRRRSPSATMSGRRYRYTARDMDGTQNWSYPENYDEEVDIDRGDGFYESQPLRRDHQEVPSDFDTREHVDYPYPEYVVMDPRRAPTPPGYSARRRLPSPAPIPRNWREAAHHEDPRELRYIDRRAYDDEEERDEELAGLMRDIRVGGRRHNPGTSRGREAVEVRFVDL